MKKFWKGVGMFALILVIVGGALGFGYWKWGTGISATTAPLTAKPVADKVPKPILGECHGVDTTVDISMADILEPGTTGAVDARYDYWVCPEGKTCTDNTNKDWQYVTGSHSQASITVNPFDRLMFLVGDDGDASADSTNDWYKTISYYDVPCKESDKLSFPLCKEVNMTMVVLNADNSVNSATNQQALSADAEKTLKLRLTGEPNGCYSAPDSGKYVKICMDANLSAYDDIYLSGSNVIDQDSDIPRSDRATSDWCSDINLDHIDEGSTYEFSIVLDVNSGVDPGATADHNVSIRAFDVTGYRDKATGLPMMGYNNASDLDIGIAVTEHAKIYID